MEQPHRDARRGDRSGTRLGPFDEHHRVVEVRLDIAPLRRRHSLEAVEIEMRDRDVALIAVGDRERRARDRTVEAERTASAADEGRLPRAEVTRDRDDVSETKIPGQLRPDLLGLRGRGRLDRDQKMLSWTAGSCTASTTTGSIAGSSPPSSSGMRAKSCSSTLSIAGV